MRADCLRNVGPVLVLARHATTTAQRELNNRRLDILSQECAFTGLTGSLVCLPWMSVSSPNQNGHSSAHLQIRVQFLQSFRKREDSER